MACRLSGAKPLPEPMMQKLSVGPLGTYFSEIWIEIKIIHENAFETDIR